MKREILDEIEDPMLDTYEIDAEPIYASKSVKRLILSILVLFGYLIVNTRTLDFIEMAVMKPIVQLGFGIILFWLNLSGMINASKSERFQERESWKKYVGSVGNLLFFIPSFIILLSAMVVLISNLFSGNEF